MNSFRKIVEKELFSDIENAFGDKLLPFLDSLQFYVDFNDEQSKKEIVQCKKELKKCGFLEKNNGSVYRLARLDNTDIKKVNNSSKQKQKVLTSASTEKITGKILNLMKDMIKQYKQKGDYYYLEITDYEGFDINKFANVFLNNKDEILKKYSDPNDKKVILFFYDTIESKKEQKEFLIFGSYYVENIEKI